MKEILTCGNCLATFSGDAKDKGICPDCGEKLVSLHIQKEEWDLLSDEEKTELKKRNKVVREVSMEARVTTMEQDIHMIRNILIFFTVLWVLSFFVSLMSLGR